LRNYLYFFLDFASLLLPLFFSLFSKNKFLRKWKSILPAIFIPGILFCAWDVWFTSQGIWGFNPDYISGIYLINLPIEEVLFFICIPYACLFSYESFCIFLSNKKFHREAFHRITELMILIFLLAIILHASKKYTVATLSATCILLTVLRVLKGFEAGRFYMAFLCMLIPFLIFNSILTGTGLNAPIVWYNDQENLGIRIGTIPIEDAVYGFLLVGTNVLIFDYLQKKDPDSRVIF
jgi:lycopene cyclase domain-containing protein